MTRPDYAPLVREGQGKTVGSPGKERVGKPNGRVIEGRRGGKGGGSKAGGRGVGDSWGGEGVGGEVRGGERRDEVKGKWWWGRVDSGSPLLGISIWRRYTLRACFSFARW